MIRRLVNGFVHDLRLPQLHRQKHVISRCFVASSAQETEKDIFPAERERVRKLIHRLHVSGGHVSKTSLRVLLQRRGCLVWMQHMVDQLQCVIRVSNPVTPKMHNKFRWQRLQNCGRR